MEFCGFVVIQPLLHRNPKIIEETQRLVHWFAVEGVIYHAAPQGKITNSCQFNATIVQ
jgi:hypothetical protein